MTQDAFDAILAKARRHLESRGELFVFDGWACAEHEQSLAVRVVADRIQQLVRSWDDQLMEP